MFISCQKEIKKDKKPSFLIGDLIRTSDKKGSFTYETWQTDYTGLVLTLKEKDTVFKEVLSIISKNDTLFLQVEGVNETPTLFKFTQQTDTSFVCENPKNEFPKKIKYWLENKQLKAVVSAEEYKIEFIFEKIK
jgi:hypothetical protein